MIVCVHGIKNNYSPCKQHQNYLLQACCQDGNLEWLPLVHDMNIMLIVSPFLQTF